MATKGIPNDIKAQVEAIVTHFNQTVVRDPTRFFQVRFRSKFAYLDRAAYGHIGPRGRLTYTGDMAQWDFAIYKYSDERYDPEEWFFPGAGEVDGTVAGALRACMKAYP
ncbi:MAG: hypothetical protein JXA21_22985 [Anaerolineae bacterium]|nr:hypothetical protein [Anaerolineae bacterium]